VTPTILVGGTLAAAGLLTKTGAPVTRSTSPSRSRRTPTPRTHGTRRLAPANATSPEPTAVASERIHQANHTEQPQRLQQPGLRVSSSQSIVGGPTRSPAR
jgi:hypothetical protein